MMETDPALREIVNQEATDFRNVGTITLSDLIRVQSSTEGTKFFEEVALSEHIIAVHQDKKEVEETDSLFDTKQIAVMEFY